jgi:hypothetical protein
LSQQPAKVKILAGLPAIALIATSFFVETQSVLTSATGLFLFAYALIGLIELKLDKSYPDAKHAWQKLSGWKKLAISVVTIVAATAIFIALIPFVSKLIYE